MAERTFSKVEKKIVELQLKEGNSPGGWNPPHVTFAASMWLQSVTAMETRSSTFHYSTNLFLKFDFKFIVIIYYS